MEKSGSPGRDQQDHMPWQTNQLTSRSLGKWHGNSKKLSTLPSPWKRAEQFPWVPWLHHTSALQRVPIEGSSRIRKGASTWRVVYSLLVCPLKHPIKRIPHTKLRVSTSVSLKFSRRTGEIRKRRQGTAKLGMCRTVPQRRGFSAQSADFPFLPGADHQESWEEVISRLPRKVPESFYSCLGAENSSAFSQGNRNTSGQDYSHCTLAIHALGQR